MKLLRAILTGGLLRVIFFIEWSIMVLAPVIKDLQSIQYTIHYIRSFQ